MHEKAVTLTDPQSKIPHQRTGTSVKSDKIKMKTMELPRTKKYNKPLDFKQKMIYIVCANKTKNWQTILSSVVTLWQLQLALLFPQSLK